MTHEVNDNCHEQNPSYFDFDRTYGRTLTVA